MTPWRHKLETDRACEREKKRFGKMLPRPFNERVYPFAECRKMRTRFNEHCKLTNHTRTTIVEFNIIWNMKFSSFLFSLSINSSHYSRVIIVQVYDIDRNTHVDFSLATNVRILSLWNFLSSIWTICITLFQKGDSVMIFSTSFAPIR